MLAKAAQEFDELCEIKDIKDRVRIACEKFSAGNISAKAIRLLYDKLDTQNKMTLLEGIYDEKNPNTLENMRRCPPNMFLFEGLSHKRREQYSLAFIIAQEIIYKYKVCKIPENKQRYEKACRDVENLILAKYGLEDNVPWLLENGKRIALEKIIRRKEHTTSKLNLPTNMTIGVELEFTGVDRRIVGNFMGRLGLNVVDKILHVGHEEKSFSAWQIKSDISIKQKKKVKENGKWTTKIVDDAGHAGVEIVSPILEDSEYSWRQLESVCNAIKFLGGRCNDSCGGHIHIGSDVLGLDTNAWKNFVTMWREVEPLIYIISNRRGESSRAKIGKYASSVEGEIDSTLCFKSISIRTEDDLKDFAKSISGHNRYKGLNLINLSPISTSLIKPKRTIEFRIPNGIIDYEIIRENILLFGKMLKISKLRSIEPTIKQKEFESFMEPGLEEREKLTRFLDFVFDTDEERQTFFKRWLYNAGNKEKITVRRRKYSKQNEPNPKEIMEQIREISETVDSTRQMEAMETMIEDFERQKEVDRND